jgi:Pyruvate/2-oxoacid:ferredoxin oxidoreductase delta subunit
MFSEDEMRLVLLLASQADARPANAQEVALGLGIPEEQAAGLLEHGYRRAVLDRQEDEQGVTYLPAVFYRFLGHFAKFGQWDLIPADARQIIDRRYLSAFVDRHRESIRKKMQGLATQDDLPNDAVLLLPEVEEMLRAAADIVVQPCDCRRLGQYCGRPVDTCLWLDESARQTLARGNGRRLTVDEAIQLVRWADDQGLMHTGDAAWQKHGLHAICNCCACDCYPFRAAQLMNSRGYWPRNRYVAAHDAERCTDCGLCVDRCHFAAFRWDEGEADAPASRARQLVFDPGRCWGCGLCANTCPEEAITMQQVPEWRNL